MVFIYKVLDKISHRTLVWKSEKGCVTIYLQCSVHFKGEHHIYVSTIAILLQRPVYCFWRADFHGQGATRATPDNLMYSLPTISP
jgi:hypothetical protein